jgi:Putative beta barrel porin-7 (BBP7)
MNYAFLSSIAAAAFGIGAALAQAPVPVDSPSTFPPSSVGGETKASALSQTTLPRVVPKGVAPNLPPPGDGAAGQASCRTDWGKTCAPCGPTSCGPDGMFWARADYLLWWTKGSRVPPLVTTSPAASGGIIGPGTTVLLGGSRLDSDPSSGVRFALGFWLDEEHTIGLEGGGLFLGGRSTNFVAGGDGGANSPTIARPFFNVNTGREDSELVSAPNFLAGTVAVHSSSRLAGGDVNGLLNLACGCNNRLDAAYGFRYFQLNDGLGIAENLAVTPNVPGLGGSTFALLDQFDTVNRFYGGQIGLRDEFRRGRFFVDLSGTVALGAVQQVVNIRGATALTPPGGATVVQNGGLLALPSNIGHYTRSRFAVLPEMGLNVGYQLTDGVRIYTGYNFLYLSKAVRPGDQIDRVLNPTQLPVIGGIGGLVGAPRPSFQYNETDYWAQGIEFGLEFRY